MQLTHRFTVPGGLEETWERFGDIADVAQCFPGAQVTSAEGDTFEGTVKVKLGPIALVYAGSGSFVAKDPAAHTFVVEAKGRDKRGNGTAGATVNVAMSEGAGGTDVQVDTDLSITGKPAQFGRGVLQDVSDKLLAQFVACLEQRSSAAAPEVAAEDEPEREVAADNAAPEPAGGVSGAGAGGGAGPADDAIDLGSTVLPVLARSYWRQALAGLAGLAGVLAVILVVRRRRR